MMLNGFLKIRLLKMIMFHEMFKVLYFHGLTNMMFINDEMNVYYKN